jgi:hypothetical protein
MSLIRPLWLLVALAALAAACGSSGGAPGSPTPTLAPIETPDPIRGLCKPTTEHVPFALVLPTYLPAGVEFLEACVHPYDSPSGIAPLENVEVYYRDRAETAWFQVVTAKLQFQPSDAEPMQLGGLTAFARAKEREDGTVLYSVEMFIGERAYTVIAILGEAAGNTLTKEDLNRIAESIAVQAPG